MRKKQHQKSCATVPLSMDTIIYLNMWFYMILSNLQGPGTFRGLEATGVILKPFPRCIDEPAKRNTINGIEPNTYSWSICYGQKVVPV